MKFGTANFGPAFSGEGHTSSTAHVPFAELVQPFLYIGEEIFRAGMGVAHSAAGAAGAVSKWRNQRATMKALQALEDHRLDDIGVRREEIPELARKLAHG